MFALSRPKKLRGICEWQRIPYSFFSLFAGDVGLTGKNEPVLNGHTLTNERSNRSSLVCRESAKELQRKSFSVLGPKYNIQEPVGNIASYMADHVFVISDRKHLDHVKAVSADKIINMAPTLSGRDIATVFEACRKGNYGNEEMFEALADRLLGPDDVLSVLSNNAMSQIIHGLGVTWQDARFRQNFFPSFKPLVQQLVVECLERERLEYNEFTEHGLCNAIFGFGMMYAKAEGGLDKEHEVIQLVDLLLRKLVKEDRLPNCMPQAISNVLQGCAYLGYIDHTSREILCREIESRIRQSLKLGADFTRSHLFVSSVLANLVVAFGKMRYLDKGMMDAISDAIRANPIMFSHKDLAKVILGFGQLQYRNLNALQTLCGEVTRELRLYRFSEAQLVDVLRGFGALKFNHTLTMKCLSEQVRRNSRLPRFSSREIGDAVYAFGQVGYKCEEMLLPLMGEIVKTGRITSFSATDLCNIMCGLGSLKFTSSYLHRLGKTLSKRVMFDAYETHQVVKIMHAYHELMQKDVDVFGRFCTELGKSKRVKELTAKELCEVVSAVSAFVHFNERLSVGLLNGTIECLDDLDAKSITSMVHCWALMKDQMPHDFLVKHMDRFLRRITRELCNKERINVLNSSEVSKLAWSLATLQYYAPELMNALIDRFVGQSSESREVLDMLHACALVNHRHDAFLDVLRKSIDSHLRGIDQASLIINALWGLSVLDVLTPKTFYNMGSKLHWIMSESDEPDTSGFKKIVKAWLKVKSNPQQYRSLEYVQFLEDVKQRWKSEEDIKSTKLSEQVLDTLKGLGIDYDFYGELEEGCIVVDALLELEPQIALITNGPDSYCINKIDGRFRALGDVVLRNDLIEQSGAKCLPVPYFEWEKLSEEARKQWLKKKIEMCSVSEGKGKV